MISKIALFALFFLSALLKAESDPSTRYELEPLTVTEDQEKKSTPSVDPSHQTLQMEKTQLQGASQTLVKSPSISIQKLGNDEGSQLLSIRGQDPAQTRLYLNGFPLSENSVSGLDTRWLHPSWLSKMEIYPNGDPVHLWSESLGGAVDMVSPYFQSEPVAEKNSIGALLGSFGSRGLQGQVRGNSLTLGAYARQSTDDYTYLDNGGTLWNPTDDTERTRQHNRWWRASFFPSYRERWGKTEATGFLLAGWEAREVGDFLAAGTHLNAEEQLQLVGVKIGDGSREIGVFGRYRKNEIKNLNLQRGSTLSALPGMSSEWSGGIRAALKESISANWVALGSLLFKATELENQTDTAIQPAYKTRRQSLVLAPELNYGSQIQSALTLPVSVDFYPAFNGVLGYAPQAAKQYVLLNPRWKLSIPIFRGVVRTGVQYVQRPPGLSDLYGDAWGLIPNPKLKEEKSFKAEIGVDIQRKLTNQTQGTLSATSSWSRNQDLFTRVLSGPMSSMMTNIGASQIFSQELSLRATHAAGWKIEGTGQYLITENLTNNIAYARNKELPFRPGWRIQGNLEKSFGSFLCGYLWQWQSGFYTDIANLKRVQGFQEHSIYTRYVSVFLGQWALEFSNLFDVTLVRAELQGQTVSSFASGYSGFPYPGRRVYVSWNYDW